MTNRSTPRTALLFIGLSAAMLIAACSAAAGPSPSPVPSPSARPTPTPIVARVTTPEAAAALVIAADPRFAGTMPLSPDVIGASQWWVATPLASGGYSIELTIGWGDCPAGCINKHVWTYEVTSDGQVKLVSETGEPVPADLPG